jgi:hypothetical protein
MVFVRVAFVTICLSVLVMLVACSSDSGPSDCERNGTGVGCRQELPYLYTCPRGAAPGGTNRDGAECYSDGEDKTKTYFCCRY